MSIDHVFAVKDSGKAVVVGTVAAGEVRPGDRLVLRVPDGDLLVKVEALEAFSRPVRVARRGESVGILLRGSQLYKVGRGTELLSEKG